MGLLTGGMITGSTAYRTMSSVTQTFGASGPYGNSGYTYCIVGDCTAVSSGCKLYDGSTNIQNDLSRYVKAGNIYFSENTNGNIYREHPGYGVTISSMACYVTNNKSYPLYMMYIDIDGMDAHNGIRDEYVKMSSNPQTVAANSTTAMNMSITKSGGFTTQIKCYIAGYYQAGVTGTVTITMGSKSGSATFNSPSFSVNIYLTLTAAITISTINITVS